MALIRYYNLESQSDKEVSDLERNLQKHLLSEKHVKGLIDSADAEALAQAEASTDDSLATLLYDSGEFDVLYKKSSTITKGKNRWFRNNVAPRIGTEIVIQATPEDVIELQGYLASSGFEVVEARSISKATLSFATAVHQPESSKLYSESIEELLREEYQKLKAVIKNRDNAVNWEGRNGHYCSGIITGDVKFVLQLRKLLLNSSLSYGTSIQEESVTFSY